MFKYLLLVVLTLMISRVSYARHIVGGYMSYEVVTDMGPFVGLQIDMTLYRDDTDLISADFDNTVTVYFFDLATQDFIASATLLLRTNKLIDASNCGDPVVYRGDYQGSLTLSKGVDYYAAYQRCCRSVATLGVDRERDQLGDGLLLYMTIYQAALSSKRVGPVLSEDLNVCLASNQDNQVVVQVEAHAEARVEAFLSAPYAVGGSLGTMPSDQPGDERRCDGIIPDLRLCPPPYGTITYLPGFSADTPFGPTGTVSKVEDLTFVIRPTLLGKYIYALVVQESINDQVLSETFYEGTFVVNEPVSIALQPTTTTWSHYPNPVTDHLYIDVSTTVDYQVLTMYGQIVDQGTTAGTISTRDLLLGQYLLRVGDQVSRFVKQ